MPNTFPKNIHKSPIPNIPNTSHKHHETYPNTLNRRVRPGLARERKERFPFVSLRLNHSNIIQNSIKNQSKIDQNGAKPLKIHQNGSQNRSERQGRFRMPKMVPTFTQNGANGAKTDPKWSQKGSKMDAKSLQKSMQKSMPKKLRKMMQKWTKHDAKMIQKLIRNLTFS